MVIKFPLLKQYSNLFKKKKGDAGKEKSSSQPNFLGNLGDVNYTCSVEMLKDTYSRRIMNNNNT
jgi:hypothetical protein